MCESYGGTHTHMERGPVYLEFTVSVSSEFWSLPALHLLLQSLPPCLYMFLQYVILYT